MDAKDRQRQMLREDDDMKRTIGRTPRGFRLYARFDHRDYHTDLPERYSVHESSLATERKVWVGGEDRKAHLNEAEARMVRDALSEFLNERPWWSRMFRR
jgi:hypothetical protein